MKNALYCLICLLFSASLAYSDPGIADTVRVDAVSAIAGEKVVVPVYYFNDEPLGGIEVVLDYNAGAFSLDSVSLIGSRLEVYNDLNFVLFDSSGIIDMLFFDFSQWFDTGNGLLCNLHFEIKESVMPQTYSIDSTTRIYDQFTQFSTVFSDSMAQPIYPQFTAGQITVLDSPPASDSIWVQYLTSEAGETVELELYGYNSQPTDTINIALNYSSDDITILDANYAGTRAASAQSRLFNVRPELNQVLITLIYDQNSPLETGTGTLARLVIAIDEAAPDQEVVFDSTSYLGIQALEISHIGVAAFAPYFTPGSLTISTATDVDDDQFGLLPTNFALSQNAPNPFNPSTEIRFNLPQASNVRINVFNILGQNVKLLINEYLPAGRHSVTFDGNDNSGASLASGIYFYRMIADDFQSSKKMTLLK